MKSIETYKVLKYNKTLGFQEKQTVFASIAACFLGFYKGG